MDKHHSLTVEQKLLSSIALARAADMPIIMLDTMEFDIVRSVVYSMQQPVTPAQKTDCWELLTGEQASPDLAGNIHLMLDASPSFTEPHVYVNLLRYQDATQAQWLQAFAEQALLHPGCATYALLYGKPEHLPEHLHPFVHIVEVPYPDQQEVRTVIESIMNAQELTLPQDAMQRLAQRLRGFTVPQIRTLMKKIIATRLKDGRCALDHAPAYNAIIRDEKKQILLRNGDILQLISTSKPQLGGMGGITKRIEKLRDIMLDPERYAELVGTGIPKGILLHGTPGCGKSALASLLAWEWHEDDVPMNILRMDVGRLMGGFLGDSERALRRALSLVEAMSPVILWLDEIEKGLQGMSGSGSGDSGTSGRMFSKLLTWLQERTAPCFVYATANSLKGLADELFRKGRMDELYSVFMPTHTECVEIFKSCMLKQEKNALEKRKQNGNPDTTPVFSPGCYHKLDQVIGKRSKDELVGVCLCEPASGRPPHFVTGADINYIVGEASRRCVEKQLPLPLSANDWIAQLKDVIADPTLSTTGSGADSLFSIALGCLHTLRGKFVPVAEASQVLFHPADYHVVYAKSSDAAHPVESVHIDSVCPSQYAYDVALHAAVKDCMDAIALDYERLNHTQKISP